MNLDKIALKVVQQAEKGVINEKEIVKISDENGLSLVEFANLCDIISEIGISIVEDQSIVTQCENDDISKILSLYNNLSSIDKEKCYSMITAIHNGSDLKDDIRNQFVSKIARMKLQYSYIAVFLKAFFNNYHDQSIDLECLISYYRHYYSSRKNNKLIVEQNDSVFSKESYTDNDIRKNILFNPMKRSFVSNYFSFDKKTNLVYITSELYQQLSRKDVSEILTICDNKLEEYYCKIKR